VEFNIIAATNGFLCCGMKKGFVSIGANEWLSCNLHEIRLEARHPARRRLDWHVMRCVSFLFPKADHLSTPVAVITVGAILDCTGRGCVGGIYAERSLASRTSDA